MAIFSLSGIEDRKVFAVGIPWELNAISDVPSHLGIIISLAVAILMNLSALIFLGSALKLIEKGFIVCVQSLYDCRD